MKAVVRARPQGLGEWRKVRLAVMVLSLAVSACATVQNPDPLEPVNRKMFAFNETMDRAILKPAAKGWEAVTPEGVRTGLSNFFNHIKDLWSAFNLVLQGRPGLGMQEVTRFGVNTVFGLGGFLDPATELGMNSQHQDLGLTLARWGVPSGAYLVWPFFGPSTVRDSVGLPLEAQMYPERLVQKVAVRNAVTVLRWVNTRATLLDATQTIDDIALDKYLFVRDAYLQRRQSQIDAMKDDNLSAVVPPNEGDPTQGWVEVSPTAGLTVSLDAPAASSTVPSAGSERVVAIGEPMQARWAEAARAGRQPSSAAQDGNDAVGTPPAAALEPMHLSDEEYQAMGAHP